MQEMPDVPESTVGISGLMPHSRVTLLGVIQELGGLFELDEITQKYIDRLLPMPMNDKGQQRVAGDVLTWVEELVDEGFLRSDGHYYMVT